MSIDASRRKANTPRDEEAIDDGSVRFERAPFLLTARALAVCSRELARLNDALVRGVTALHPGSAKDKPVVREAPGRLIVQLGPVALTVTWLRPGHATVEDGELLIILWRGAVAPRGEHIPERSPLRRAASSATALWEQTLRPVATEEATWVWKAAGAKGRSHSSAELGDRCVERLRVAYEAHAVGND